MASVFCAGIATWDIVMAVPEFPRSAQKHRATDRREIGGGVAATAAVAVARLGGHAEFAGRVGDDAAGRSIVAGLESEGVGVGGVQWVPGASSPISMALIDAAGERLTVNHASPDLFDAGTAQLPEVDAVLSDMRWPGGGCSALEAAAARGIPGVLDCDHDPHGRDESLAAASHIIFALPTLAAHVGTSDPGEALRRAAAPTGAWVAATAGDEGVHWLTAGETAHMPAFDVPVVDTLGAGDVFHGAFALRLAEGADEETALRFGSAAAALKCTHFGGRAGIPAREEVDAFLDVRS